MNIYTEHSIYGFCLSFVIYDEKFGQISISQQAEILALSIITPPAWVYIVHVKIFRAFIAGYNDCKVIGSDKTTSPKSVLELEKEGESESCAISGC